MTRLFPALPFEQWPEGHQDAWRRMLAGGDIFDERGPAHSWRPATIKTNRAHSARWLFYCQAEIPEPWPTDPTELVTRETVKGYLAGFRNKVSSVTTHGAVVGICTVVKAMAPDKNWFWLSGLCGRLKRQATPQTDKLGRMVYAIATA